jgi:hypothetical protein
MAPGFSDKAKCKMFDAILKNVIANVTPVAMTPHPAGFPSPSPDVQEPVKKKRK